METVIADNPEDEELQALKRALEELAAMTPEERKLDARWALLSHAFPSGKVIKE